MGLQYSVGVRNARLDAVEATIGASAVLRIWAGALPASCATADPAAGNKLAEIALPADWMQAAAAGSKQMSGAWADNAADNGGVAGFFRIYDASGTTCHAQGTITATGAGGDMTVDNTNFAAGQQFTVTGFTLTAGNA